MVNNQISLIEMLFGLSAFSLFNTTQKKKKKKIEQLIIKKK